jgi:Spy/CpxP family protein refolding chaperone
MKPETRSRFTARAALMLVLAMFLSAETARAQDDPAPGRGAARRQNLAQRAERGFDRMAEALDLTSQQKVLLEEVKSKTRAFAETQRGQRRAMRHSMIEEMAKDKPDPHQIASETKDRFRKESAPAFDTMVDATSAFYASLTPEQRAALKGISAARGGRARQHLPQGRQWRY